MSAFLKHHGIADNDADLAAYDASIADDTDGGSAEYVDIEGDFDDYDETPTPQQINSALLFLRIGFPVDDVAAHLNLPVLTVSALAEAPEGQAG